MNRLTSLVLGLAMLTACVPKGKYVALEEELASTRAQLKGEIATRDATTGRDAGLPAVDRDDAAAGPPRPQHRPGRVPQADDLVFVERATRGERMEFVDEQDLGAVHVAETGDHVVVEQRLVRGRASLGAEVLLGLDQAKPEQAFPDAIHVHPGGERIVPAGDPAGEAETIRRGVGVGFVQERRNGGDDLLARTPPVDTILLRKTWCMTYVSWWRI